MRVQGFRLGGVGWGAGSEVKGSGFGVEGLGFRVQSPRRELFAAQKNICQGSLYGYLAYKNTLLLGPYGRTSGVTMGTSLIKTPPFQDPTEGLYLEPYGGPRGGGLFLMSEVIL
jgi:hypothetical protein